MSAKFNILVLCVVLALVVEDIEATKRGKKVPMKKAAKGHPKGHGQPVIIKLIASGDLEGHADAAGAAAGAHILYNEVDLDEHIKTHDFYRAFFCEVCVREMCHRMGVDPKKIEQIVKESQMHDKPKEHRKAFLAIFPDNGNLFVSGHDGRMTKHKIGGSQKDDENEETPLKKDVPIVTQLEKVNAGLTPADIEQETKTGAAQDHHIHLRVGAFLLYLVDDNLPHAGEHQVGHKGPSHHEAHPDAIPAGDAPAGEAPIKSEVVRDDGADAGAADAGAAAATATLDQV